MLGKLREEGRVEFVKPGRDAVWEKKGSWPINGIRNGHYGVVKRARDFNNGITATADAVVNERDQESLGLHTGTGEVLIHRCVRIVPLMRGDAPAASATPAIGLGPTNCLHQGRGGVDAGILWLLIPACWR